ncbi:MAG: glycosyltransferase family 25 protein [Pseudobdellovibrionaceae bacterium]
MKIFVINRKKDADRRVKMEEQARKLGLELTFIEAVDGYALDDAEISAVYEASKRLRIYGRAMTRGEIGCYLSHRKTYEMMVAQKLPRALILEDDVVLEDNLPDCLDMIAGCSVQWDVLRFLYRKKIEKRGYRKVYPFQDGTHALVRLPNAPGGTYAYMVTLQAAERLLSLTQKIWMPIDIVIGRSWATNLEAYAFMPSPIKHFDEGESVIGAARFDKTLDLTTRQKVVHKLCKPVFKFSEMGRKYAYFYGKACQDRRSIRL